MAPPGRLGDCDFSTGEEPSLVPRAAPGNGRLGCGRRHPARPLLFGGPLLLLVIPGSMVVALHLARHNPWRGTDIVMLGTLMLWLVCTVAFWVAFAVSVIRRASEAARLSGAGQRATGD